MMCLVWLDVGTSSLLTLISNADFNKVPTAQSSIDIIVEDLGINKKMMFK